MPLFEWLGETGITEMWLPVPVALAAVALLGYVLGRRARQSKEDETETRTQRDIEKTRLVAQELGWIADKVRKSLAKHHTSLARFQKRFRHLEPQDMDRSFSELCSEAEDVLEPTLQLADDVSRAYDQIRQQSRQLLSFGVPRTGAVRGARDRAVLDEALHAMFAMQHQFGLTFAVAMLCVEDVRREPREDGGFVDEKVLRKVAKWINNDLRSGDVLVRDTGRRFVIVLPAADVAAAHQVASRLHNSIRKQFSLKVNGGVAMALPGETPDDLLGRVHEAIHAAEESVHGAILRHDGERISPSPGDKVLA